MNKGLSDYKVKKIRLYFCEAMTASQTATLLGMNRNTMNRYVNLFRRIIAASAIKDSSVVAGDMALDASSFGAKSIRGKRGRGAAGKTPVWGLLKRHGRVHVEVVEHCSKDPLMPILQGKILEGSTLHTDGWKAYDGWMLNG